MRASRLPRPAGASRILALTAVVVGVAAAAPGAAAHGGSTVAEGGKDDVSVLVQGVASQTASGGPAVDVSTILSGPGTGSGADVDYWIRPSDGKKAFKVETERDEGGTFHADVSTAERGTWSDWAVSAIVTLNDDRRLRVANVSGADIPGPAPARRVADADANADADRTPPTSPTLSEGPSTPEGAPPPDAEGADVDGGVAIDDISGESDGPPGWAFPSLLVLTVIGLAILAVKRRRPRQD